MQATIFGDGVETGALYWQRLRSAVYHVQSSLQGLEQELTAASDSGSPDSEFALALQYLEHIGQAAEEDCLANLKLLCEIYADHLLTQNIDSVAAVSDIVESLVKWTAVLLEHLDKPGEAMLSGKLLSFLPQHIQIDFQLKIGMAGLTDREEEQLQEESMPDWLEEELAESEGHEHGANPSFDDQDLMPVITDITEMDLSGDMLHEESEQNPVLAELAEYLQELAEDFAGVSEAAAAFCREDEVENAAPLQECHRTLGALLDQLAERAIAAEAGDISEAAAVVRQHLASSAAVGSDTARIAGLLASWCKVAAKLAQDPDNAYHAGRLRELTRDISGAEYITADEFDPQEAVDSQPDEPDAPVSPAELLAQTIPALSAMEEILSSLAMDSDEQTLAELDNCRREIAAMITAVQEAAAADGQQAVAESAATILNHLDSSELSTAGLTRTTLLLGQWCHLVLNTMQDDDPGHLAALDSLTRDILGENDSMMPVFEFPEDFAEADDADEADLDAMFADQEADQDSGWGGFEEQVILPDDTDAQELAGEMHLLMEDGEQSHQGFAAQESEDDTPCVSDELLADESDMAELAEEVRDLMGEDLSSPVDDEVLQAFADMSDEPAPDHFGAAFGSDDMEQTADESSGLEQVLAEAEGRFRAMAEQVTKFVDDLDDTVARESIENIRLEIVELMQDIGAAAREQEFPVVTETAATIAGQLANEEGFVPAPQKSIPLLASWCKAAGKHMQAPDNSYREARLGQLTEEIAGSLAVLGSDLHHEMVSMIEEASMEHALSDADEEVGSDDVAEELQQMDVYDSGVDDELRDEMESLITAAENIPMGGELEEPAGDDETWQQTATEESEAQLQDELNQLLDETDANQDDAMGSELFAAERHDPDDLVDEELANEVGALMDAVANEQDLPAGNPWGEQLATTELDLPETDEAALAEEMGALMDDALGAEDNAAPGAELADEEAEPLAASDEDPFDDESMLQVDEGEYEALLAEEDSALEALPEQALEEEAANGESFLFADEGDTETLLAEEDDALEALPEQALEEETATGEPSLFADEGDTETLLVEEDDALEALPEQALEEKPVTGEPSLFADEGDTETLLVEEDDALEALPEQALEEEPVTEDSALFADEGDTEALLAEDDEALEALPKQGLEEESVAEELALFADEGDTEALLAEDDDALEALPEQGLEEESVAEEPALFADEGDTEALLVDDDDALEALPEQALEDVSVAEEPSLFTDEGDSEALLVDDGTVADDLLLVTPDANDDALSVVEASADHGDSESLFADADEEGMLIDDSDLPEEFLADEELLAADAADAEDTPVADIPAMTAEGAAEEGVLIDEFADGDVPEGILIDDLDDDELPEGVLVDEELLSSATAAGDGLAAVGESPEDSDEPVLIDDVDDIDLGDFADIDPAMLDAPIGDLDAPLGMTAEPAAIAEPSPEEMLAMEQGLEDDDMDGILLPEGDDTLLLGDDDDDLDFAPDADFSGEDFDQNNILDVLRAELAEVRPQLTALNEVLCGAADAAALQKTAASYRDICDRLMSASRSLGLDGLYEICRLVVDNVDAIAALEEEQRAGCAEVLTQWMDLVNTYLQSPEDEMACLNLISHFQEKAWPSPISGEKGRDVLAALIAGMEESEEAEPLPERQKTATAEDIALDIADDTDQDLLEAFFYEAPAMAEKFSESIALISSGENLEENIKQAQRVAHTLKGSGNLIGVRGLANLTHHVEDIFEYLYNHHMAPPPPLADLMSEAGDCLESIIEYLQGKGPAPSDLMRILQAVLDWANRIDKGQIRADDRETLSTTNTPAPTEEAAPKEKANAADAEAKAQDLLRVPTDTVDDMIDLLGEVSIAIGQVQEHITRLLARGKNMGMQDAIIQQRRFELENLVDVRGQSTMQKRLTQVGALAMNKDFDPLEMDQYDELYSTAHSYIEAVADSREISHLIQRELSTLEGLFLQQQRLNKSLQQLVMTTRMVAVNSISSRLHRSVRQACRATGKKVELRIIGEDMMVDSDVLDKLVDPLMHMMRNAVDHGIEDADVRAEKGKPETGTITLEFDHVGNNVRVRCYDDGGGLDYDKIRSIAVSRGLMSEDEVMDKRDLGRMILMSGFSTRETATQISGRGVGMDVVHAAILELKGSLDIMEAETGGTLFLLSLPLSLVTNHSLVIRIGKQLYAIPTVSLVQILAPETGQVRNVGDKVSFELDKEIYPARSLATLLNSRGGDPEINNRKIILLARSENGTYALTVDQLINSYELVVKPMGKYVKDVPGIGGVAVLGDGSVVPVLDLASLLRQGDGGGVTMMPDAAGPQHGDGPDLGKILIVDDSLSVRKSLSLFVKDAGFEPVAARDGLEAVELLRKNQFAVALVDMEMPRMNGLELTRHIRATGEISNLPVIMITSRTQQKHRKEAEVAGVTHYLTKPYNEDDLMARIGDYVAAARR